MIRVLKRKLFSTRPISEDAEVGLFSGVAELLIALTDLATLPTTYDQGTIADNTVMTTRPNVRLGCRTTDVAGTAHTNFWKGSISGMFIGNAGARPLNIAKFKKAFYKKAKEYGL